MPVAGAIVVTIAKGRWRTRARWRLKLNIPPLGIIENRLFLCSNCHHEADIRHGGGETLGAELIRFGRADLQPIR